MGKGFKSFQDIWEIVEKRKKTANEVRHILRPSKKGDLDEWYMKELESDQEAQIECMTGEIYRYLLGGAQPKVRVRDEHTVASASVAFLSFRDLIEKKKVEYAKFKKAFGENLEGFLTLVFAAIFLEENDLSDANYGLAVHEVANVKQYHGFVKIDHGQSFNSLRIPEEKRLHPHLWQKGSWLEVSQVKFYPPPKTRLKEDFRTKRSKLNPYLGAGKRVYALTSAFLDRIIIDFVDGRIDESYIKSLTFKPSTLPLYDSRLLPFIDALGEDKYDAMELCKYLALARIAFTSERAYLHIAKNATSTKEVPLIWHKVKEKISQNRRTFLEELEKDPDFLVFCSQFADIVAHRIEESWGLLIHKRNSQEPSERYGAGHVNPIDDALGRFQLRGADVLLRGTLPERSHGLLRGLEDFISGNPWGPGSGAVVIGGRKTKAPPYVAKLLAIIDLYDKCRLRLLRGIRDVVAVLQEAAKAKSPALGAVDVALITQVLEYANQTVRQGVSDEGRATLGLTQAALGELQRPVDALLGPRV